MTGDELITEILKLYQKFYDENERDIEILGGAIHPLEKSNCGPANSIDFMFHLLIQPKQVPINTEALFNDINEFLQSEDTDEDIEDNTTTTSDEDETS